MSHGLDASQIAATEGPVVRPICMVRLDFPVQSVLAHSGVGTITYNSEDYLGVGNYGGISAVKEGLESRPYNISLSLSGIPTTLINEVLAEHYQGREAKIFIVLYDVEHQAIGAPVLIWKGKMDYPDIELGETATAAVSCRSWMADWDRPRVRRYSHADQQDRYPGDNCFEFVAQMIDKTLIWGRA